MTLHSFQPSPVGRPRAFRAPLIPGRIPALSIDWQRPVAIEIGCGTGEWAMATAAQNPGVQYIAVERTHERSAKLLRRAARSGLENLVALQADAIWLCHFHIPPASVEALYFHFPNPYPKRRQAQLRFFSGPAFWVWDRVLKPGGRIVVASNVAEYINEATAFLQQVGGYSVTRGIRDTSLPPRTAFERKYRARSETILDFIAQKPNSPSLFRSAPGGR